MHVEQMTGSIPGVIFATIRHGETIKNLSIVVMRSDSGRFISKLPSGGWSIECATVESALLMHATIIFPLELDNAPWISHAQKLTAWNPVGHPLETASSES